MIKRNNCPLCGEINFVKRVDVTDHFLTKEQFEILECINCNLLFTNPIPDQTEIFRYYQSENYDSHKINKTSISGVVYSIVRNFKIRNKYKLIRKLTTHTTLLDYGCGTGDFIKFLYTKGFLAYGIEPTEAARNFATQNNKVKVGDLNDLRNLKPKSFGVISLWHVLEHVPNLNETILKLKDILIDDGVMIIAVPNPDSYDALHYGQFWAAYDVPRHLYHFTPIVLKNLLKTAGFELINFYPMRFDSFYISLLSEKYSRGSTNIGNAIFHGAKSNWHAYRKDGNYSSYIGVFKKIII